MTFSLPNFMGRILGFEKNFVRYVIDPLHGQIGLTDIEDRTVETIAFRRLRNIQQLGFASIVYPSATHRRYEHCIGTLHVTWMMLKRFMQNYVAQENWCNQDVLDSFSDEILGSLRLASLLHDLGHGPFSHAFEETARYLGQVIDHDVLTTYLLTHGFPEDRVETLCSGELLSRLKVIDRAKQSREELGIIPKDIREIIVAIYDTDYKMTRSEPKGFSQIRLFLNNLLKGDIGSDRIDYLLRDTYFSGLGHRFNFSDLLENLRGIHDQKSGRLLLAVDSVGRSTVEFLMITRYYHYKLIAHHPRNVLEELKFRERVRRDSKSQRREYFIKAAMDDDAIEKGLPVFGDDIEAIGTWNLGGIGIDRYRYLFYRIASDPVLRAKYEEGIVKNIVRGVNRKNSERVVDRDDVLLHFVIEKAHMPILEMYQPVYKIEKDVFEKYSVLLHDHSILLRSLARTYLEETSLLVFAKRGLHHKVSEYTNSTRHFFLDVSLFKRCMSNVDTFKSRYDFLLFALYKITQGGTKSCTGIFKFFEETEKLHNEFNLGFYDFKTADFYDPDEGPFPYAAVRGKQERLLDDLFLFEAAGLVEIRMHLMNKRFGGKSFYSDSYLITPTRRGIEMGLSTDTIPIQSALRVYPKSFRDRYELHDVGTTNART